MSDPIESVRASAAYIASLAKHVSIDADAVTRAAEKIQAKMAGGAAPGMAWDTSIHYSDGTDLTAQYILLVDALNWCFWPDPSWEYGPMVLALKNTLLADPTAFDADKLAAVDRETLKRWLGGKELPQPEERVRVVRELGTVLRRDFGGLAANLVRAAGNSAVRLVELLSAHLPGFRDSAVFHGRQVFFYKRAQICAGDLWGSFGGEGLGRFTDMERLTMFADYRVPQILRDMGVLVYTEALKTRIDASDVLPFGSEEETEIRGMTVEAVERLRSGLQQRGVTVTSVVLDWMLWEEGEARRFEIPVHHKTHTMFY